MMEHTVGVLFERCARHYGPDTAVVHGDRRVTYAEMLSQVRRTGRALLGLGLKRGDRVAILMGDRPELLSVMYGAQWAGLAIVPLNAKLASADHAHILNDSGARVLCHDGAFAPRIDAMRDELGVEHYVSVERDGVLDGGHAFEDLVGAESDGAGMPEVGPDDLVSIFYTGGTTGRPKGVAHSHRTLLSAFLSETLEMGLGDRDVFGHVAPMTHAGGAFALPVWLRGGTNLILGGFDPDRFLDAIAREGVTSTLMVPTMIYVLLEHAAADRADTSALQTVIYGAAPMGRERLVEALERYGPIFTQLYGQTEAPNQVTVLRKRDHEEALASGNLDRLSSCGRPVLIADIRLAGDDLVEVPQGESGEIIVRGPHVMLGYWNREEETAETIRDGWLCTGDIAKMDERGYVYIVDRKKDMIISGGFNVYPKEVEQVLFEHPAVRDACVIGIPDDKWGESVKAVVVTDGSAEVAEAELIAFVKERKGSVMCPKTVDFVEEIPLTAVGKHDKPALRKAYWAGRERAVS
jgi:fatty-acyl-CoA synthase